MGGEGFIFAKTSFRKSLAALVVAAFSVLILSLSSCADEMPPAIKVSINSINAIAGVKVEIVGNELFIDGKQAASWSDDSDGQCTVSITFKAEGATSPTPIRSGDTIYDAGTLTINVSDPSSNTTTATITFTNSIYIINSSSITLTVDEESNLISGLTLSKGATLVKVEIIENGQRSTITDPEHFTPEYPGNYDIILTIKGKDGNSMEVPIKGVKIKPLDYSAPTFATVNLIAEHYPWFNVLTDKSKEFLRGHVSISYISGNLYPRDDIENIMLGETTKNFETENVGRPGDGDSHCDQGYLRIKNMSPFAHIKTCKGDRGDLKKYVDQYPDQYFIVSCSADRMGGGTIEKLKSNPNYNVLKQLLEKENIIYIIAAGNTNSYGGENGSIIVELQKSLNENELEQENCRYTSASVNSKKNNKITVVGYHPNQTNTFGYDHQSKYPIGYNIGIGNIVVPFQEIPRIDELTGERYDARGTTSSFPTATVNGVIRSHLPIIMEIYPGTTLEDAMTILQSDYMYTEPYYYLDPADGQRKVGGEWYRFDTDKFISYEILQKKAIDAISLTSPSSTSSSSSTYFSTSTSSSTSSLASTYSYSTASEVALPSFPGAHYTGKGVMFEHNGKLHPITETDLLNSLISTGKRPSYCFSRTLFLKQGGALNADGTINASPEATITLHILDTDGKQIPDMTVAFTRPVK